MRPLQAVRFYGGEMSETPSAARVLAHVAIVLEWLESESLRASCGQTEAFESADQNKESSFEEAVEVMA